MDPGQMPEPDWQSDKSLLDCLYYLYTSGTASDVAFVVNGGKEQILAHKTILVSRSSVFCAMLDDPTISKWEISLLDTQQHIFSLFLRYLYTDAIDLTVDLATSLLPLARQYCVNHLVRKCETFLKENFASQNAVMFVQNSRLPDIDTREDDIDDEEDMTVESEDEKSNEEFPSADQNENIPKAMGDCMKTKSEVTESDPDKLPLDGDENGYKHLVDADGSDDKLFTDADDNSDKHMDIADADSDSDEDDNKHLEDQDSEKPSTDEKEKHLLGPDARHDIPLKTVSLPNEKSRSPIEDVPVMEEASAMDLTIEASTSKTPSGRPIQQKHYNITPAYSGVRIGLSCGNFRSTSANLGIRAISATPGTVAKFTTLFRADIPHRFQTSIVSDMGETEFHISNSEMARVDENIKSSRKKLFACNICGKGYRREDNLTSHFRVHSGEKPHKCDECGEAFSLKSTLVTHRKKHVGEKSHKCETCGLEFDLTIELKRHQKKHRGEKPHICDFCGKGFRVTGNLRSHLRTHTGEKPHKCDICGKGFNETGNLRQHLMTHRNAGEKSYICDVCGKGFDQPSYLGKHLRIHSGEKQFKCEVCGKAFNKKFNLQTHNKTHTGEKPHKCNICGKGFGLAASMRRHLLMHTGEKPHMCFICGKSYQQKESLQQHHKKVHNT